MDRCRTEGLSSKLHAALLERRPQRAGDTGRGSLLPGAAEGRGHLGGDAGRKDGQVRNHVAKQPRGRENGRVSLLFVKLATHGLSVFTCFCPLEPAWECHQVTQAGAARDD